VRVHGILPKWNDERGFGFITRDQRDEEVFAHISAFPRDGVRPQIGEILSFEIVSARAGTAANSRPQAVAIQRAGGFHKRRTLRREPYREAARRPSKWRDVFAVLAVGCIATVGIWSSRDLRATRTRTDPPALTETTRPSHDPPAPTAPTPGRVDSAATTDVSFVCDGRTRCSQMTSCVEATWFLQHCPDVQMDGDHDGIPCEQQWCSR